MKTAALITHSHPPAATEAVAVAVRGRPRGRLAPGRRQRTSSPSTATPPRGSKLVASDEPRPDLCLVLGGDGSILHALRRFARTGVPVFGVNFGTVGFLAAVERDEAEEGIRRALAGEIETIELPGLEVEARRAQPASASTTSPCTRRPHDRVAELSYRIAGEEVGHVRCDGLVAATPVGSTGYNLANQGPILAWGVKGYVVSYIAPHSLTARALVVAPRRRPPRRQRAPAASRSKSRSTATSSASSPPGESSRSASSTASAASPSCRARASTGASARSSATSPSEPRPTHAVL